MWSLIQSILPVLMKAWESLKKKPEPVEIPAPVDTKEAQDLLNPRRKK